MRFIYLVLFGLFIGQNAFGVSLFVPTDKPDCMVFSENHQASWSYKWSGKCIDGKASGKGVMEINHDIQWIHTGTYKNGRANGFGSFKNLNGTSMVGEFSDDHLQGFATITISKLDTYLLAWWEGKNAGKWTSGNYVVQGIIEDSSKLVLSCPDEKTCRRTLQDQIAAKEASNRQACSRLYVGKPVSWPEGKTCDLFGCNNFTLQGQIVGVGNGLASAKVIGDYKNGQIHEKACDQF